MPKGEMCGTEVHKSVSGNQIQSSIKSYGGKAQCQNIP